MARLRGWRSGLAAGMMAVAFSVVINWMRSNNLSLALDGLVVRAAILIPIFVLLFIWLEKRRSHDGTYPPEWQDRGW